MAVGSRSGAVTWIVRAGVEGHTLSLTDIEEAYKGAAKGVPPSGEPALVLTSGALNSVTRLHVPKACAEANGADA